MLNSRLRSIFLALNKVQNRAKNVQTNGINQLRAFSFGTSLKSSSKSHLNVYETDHLFDAQVGTIPSSPKSIWLGNTKVTLFLIAFMIIGAKMANLSVQLLEENDIFKLEEDDDDDDY